MDGAAVVLLRFSAMRRIAPGVSVAVCGPFTVAGGLESIEMCSLDQIEIADLQIDGL